jgi:hypothetical protein
MYEKLIQNLLLKLANSEAIVLIDKNRNCKFYGVEGFLKECNTLPTELDWIDIPDERVDAWWCK